MVLANVLDSKLRGWKSNPKFGRVGFRNLGDSVYPALPFSYGPRETIKKPSARSIWYRPQRKWIDWCHQVCKPKKHHMMMIRNSVVFFGLYDTIRYDTIRHDTTRYDTIGIDARIEDITIWCVKYGTRYVSWPKELMHEMSAGTWHLLTWEGYRKRILEEHARTISKLWAMCYILFSTASLAIICLVYLAMTLHCQSMLGL